MKLIISQYKLIVQALKHHNLEIFLSKGSSCTILKRRLFRILKSLKEKNGPFLKKSLGSPMPLVQINIYLFLLFLFLFYKWRKGLMPLVQRLFFFFWKFFSLFEKDLEILNLFYFIFLFFVFNIYTQTKLLKCYMKFLNSKKT